MKNIAKRGLSALLVLVMLVSLFSGLTISASAASYTYNTGTRHEVCTSLSSQAQAYYTGSYTYDALSALSGGTASSDADATNQSAMNSALFQQMQTLMSTTHTTTITYSSLTTYWPYTDASGGSAGTILFYSDQVSSSFNREHVWPKSRGSFYQTYAGSDLHHLRPTDTNVNSARGNMTMGNVRNVISGYSTYQYNGSDVLYYSTSADRVEVNDNIKGDVARILLYVWCRWGEPNLFVDDDSLGVGPGDDANNGLKVIESLDTLLQWCEMDPVDTWEMSRNDQAQNVQGNRNIFIDYPELAWQVLGQEVPTDMQTPSGKATNAGTSYTINAVSSNTAYGTVSVSGKTITAAPADGYYASGYQVTSGSATVTQNGNTFTVSASSDCTVKIIFSAKTTVTVSFSVPSGVTQAAMSGYSGDTIILPTPTGTPTGSYTYTFKGWVASTVDNVTSKPATIYEAGSSLSLSADMMLYALYTYSVGGTGSSSTYNKITTEAELTDGASYVFVSTVTGSAMSTSVASNWVKVGGTYSGDSIEPADTDVWTVSGGVISCSGGNLYSSGEKKVSLSTSTTTWTFTVSDGVWTIASGSNILSYNSSGGWRPYSGGYGSDKSFYIYKGGSGGTTYYTTVIGAACAHTNTTTTTVDATCTAAGSVTVTCDDCGAVISSTTIPMLSHNWVAGTVVAPTCTAQGYTVYTCSLCGTTKNDDYTDMVAHTVVTDAAVEATCTETGLTEGSHCSVCGTVITAQKTVKALGHSWDAGTVTQEPTETTDGIKTYTCTRCGETKTESIPALGSTYVVSFSVPDGVAAVDSISYNTNDASITLPTAEAPEGYTFLGWSATSVDSVTDRPDVLTGAYTPASSQTLYALYSYSVSDEGGVVAGDFTLVTSAPTDWSGEYVLTSADAEKVLLTDGTTPNTTAAAVALADTGMTLSGNTLSGVTDKYILVIEKVGDYYSLRLKGSTDTKYLMTSNTNSGFNTATANTADTAQWTISLSSGAAVIANASYTSRTIRYNSDSKQFRTYTSGQDPVYLYAGSASTTYYTTVIGDACQHANVTHTEAVAATCTAAGNIEYWYCADCERYFTDAECTAAITLSSTVVAATGHSYSSETTTAATCTTDGVITYTCANCGDTYTEAIPAPGHSWDEGKVTTEPTATTEGVMTYTCTVCGETKTETIPALGEKVRYTLVDTITSGTEYIMAFNYNGTYYAISYSGGFTKYEVTPVDGVISLDQGEAFLWKIESVADTTDGYTISNGTNYISGTSSSTTLSAKTTPCTWTAVSGQETGTFWFEIGSRAIGLQSGSSIKNYAVSNANNTGTEYDFDIYLFANTCTHTNTELQGYLEATCTTNGYTGDVVCLDCGAVVTPGTTILQGHDYVEVSRVEATCTTAGSINYECSRCDSTKTETVAALGHTEETDAAVPATCTETGLTEGSHCSVCNVVLTAQTETPALGHDWVLAETLEAYEHYTCSRCDATKDVYFRTVSFVVPDGVAAIESIATKDGETVTLPTPTGTPLANAKAYTFAGWVIGTVADTAAAPDFYEAGSEYTVDGDVTFTALYYYTGEESTGDTGKFVLISDPSVIADGFELIIVSNGYTSNMALGCDYASSDTNFDGRTVTVTNNTITPDSTVQIFTVIDNGDGTVSLLSDLTDSEGNDYYLASASNTSNDIKIASYQGAVGDEAKWTISTFDDGTMKITSGNYERNTILFNSSNGGLFTCYGETYYGSDSMVSNIYGVRIFASNPVYHFTTELESECLHSNGFTYADNGDGTHTKTCADGCGYTGVEAHTEELDTDNSTAATCTATGTDHYVCSFCGAARDEVVPATGHSYEAVVTTPATCSTEGVMTYTCSVCGDSYTEAIPTTDHTFGENGACTVCGAYKYVKVTEAPANWEGEYLIVYAAADGAYVFDGKNDATGNYTVGTYYGEGTDTICVANPDAYQIIVEPNGASYNIMNADADWFSYTSAKNGFSVSSTAADYTFVMAADGSVAITNAGGYSIKFNTSTKQFRFYGTSIYTTVYLYEKYGTCHHDWVLDAAASTSPTCTTSGQNVYNCSLCGETKTETIAALGHDYQYNTVDPTCTEQGYTEVTCSACDYNDIPDYSIVAALGHDFSIEPETTDTEHYIAPTATEDGLMYCQCSRCGEWDTEGVIIPALGVVTTSTYTMWTAEDFGGEYADTFKAVEQFIIVAESNGTYYAMTATEDGSNLKAVPVTLDGDTIAVASDSGVVPMIPDHTATDYNGTTIGLGFLDAEGNYLHLNTSKLNFNTTGQNGLFTVSKAYTNETFCLYVDATAKYLAFDAENACFTMASSKSAEASMYIFVADNITVTNNGVAVSTLTLAAEAEGTLGYILNLPLENQTAVWSCDNANALVIDESTGEYIAGTSGTANVTVTVSTYASDGYSNYKEYTATIPVTVGEHTHSYTETVVAPTCETAGYTLHTCACGDSYKDNEIAALGHLWDDGTVTKEPTCVDAGVKTYYCSRCEGTKMENIPALGHTPVEEILTEATCTQDGQKEIYCAVCDAHISYETIPATGHSLEAVEAVEATCTTAGNEAYYTCTVCGLPFADAEGTTELSAIPTIPATGHTEVTDAAVAPTCTATGLTEGSHCSVCNEVIVAQEVVPATDHSLELIEEVAATCTTDGNKAYYKCSVCGALFSDAEGTTALDAIPTVSATGHSYTYTDNEDGTHTATCSTCGGTVTEDHNYTDGTCVCGATEGPVPASDLVFFNKSLVLKSYTAFNVICKYSVLEKYDSYYVVFERYDSSTGTVDRVQTAGATSTASANYHSFEYPVLSYMMTDEITATLYAVKDGITYVGETYTNSVRAYALGKIGTATEAMKSVYANLLNYGARAQEHMSYKTDDLATVGLDSYESYIVTSVPTTNNTSSITSDGYTEIQLMTRALGLNAAVELQYVLKKNAAYEKEDLYAVYSFTRNGETMEGRIDGEDFALVSGYITIKVSALYATEGNTPVSLTVYSKADDSRLSETWTYSIESHVNLKVTGEPTTTQQKVLVALMNYYNAVSAAY